MLAEIGWDKSMSPREGSGATELIFPEFVRLLLSGEVEKHFVDWRSGTHLLRIYRFGFELADLDGNGAVQVKDLLLLGTAFGARC